MGQGDEPTKIGGEVKLKPLVQGALLLVFLALGAAAYWLDANATPTNGYSLGHISSETTVAFFLSIVFFSAAAYEAVTLAVQFAIRQRGGSPGEVTMLTNFLRVLVALVIVVALIYSTGKLKEVSALVGVFAGMLLGWSLQAPVSGMAAWALVTLKRPFRIGDRVLFPALGLVGDVEHIGLMYTELNQVGGSIGSEEAIGRNVLIPNAMLFSQVVINYTAKQQAPYFLDEVIIRLTYDSDWDVGEKILLDAAREVAGDIIRETGKEPYIRADIYDYGVYMRLRYMTPAWDRPRIAHEILKKIFHEFQRNPRVDFAIPYIYSYRKGIEGGARGGGAEPTSEVSVESIDDPEANVPLRPADPNYIAELAGRIQQMGLLQPVVVQRAPNGRYVLVAGRFRLLACQRLGWKIIPAIVKESEAGWTLPPGDAPPEKPK